MRQQSRSSTISPMIVVMVRTILLGLLAALALAPSALAAPPTLVTLTQSGGKTAATWTLPAGGQVWTIEVAKTSTVDPDGYFLADDVVDAQVFIDRRTSWTSDEVLAPGTYYVHLSGWDAQCGTCPIPEWSSVRTLTVPGSSSSGTASGPSGPTSSGGGTSSSAPTSSAPGSSSASPSASAPVASVAPVVSDGFGTVSAVTANQRGGLATIAFRVCGSGTVDVKVLAVRGTRSHAAVVTLPLAGGCTGYSLRLGLPTGAGKASVSVAAGGGTAVVKPL
jgi:hypothetical protein